MHDTEGRGDERVSRHQHLVTCAYPSRHQDQRDRRRARCDAYALLCLAVIGELTLEGLDLWAENERISRDDSVERCAKLIPETLVLPGQTRKGDHPLASLPLQAHHTVP